MVSLFGIGFLNAQIPPGNYNIKNLTINTKYSDFGIIFYEDSYVVFSSPKSEKTLIKTV